MKQSPDVSACPLFNGLTSDSVAGILQCLSAKTAVFDKGDVILDSGSSSELVGIVISGEAQTVSDDFWGNRSIVMRHERDSLFGETFACLNNVRMPVSVVAARRTEVIFINGKRIITPCSKSCGEHSIMMRNMVKLISAQNIDLMRKVQHVSRRTTREKLLSYLSSQALKQGSRSFVIPFNREELADYLSVDRSAMSKELSRMRDDGLIDFRTSHFTLYRDGDEERGE